MNVVSFFAAAAGFDGLELMVDNRYETRNPAHLHSLMQQYGLPILAVHSPFRHVPGWPVDQPGLVQYAAALAEDSGAGIVVHHCRTTLACCG